MNAPAFDMNSDLDVLTGTLYGEIRGGTPQAQQNVAQVILNRAHQQPSKTVAEICLAPYQFSCWLASDPNRNKILTAPQTQPLIWSRLRAIAQAALDGKNPNRINMAANYYAASMQHAPNWSRPPAVVTLNDGFHVFIRL